MPCKYNPFSLVSHIVFSALVTLQVNTGYLSDICFQLLQFRQIREWDWSACMKCVDCCAGWRLLKVSSSTNCLLKWTRPTAVTCRSVSALPAVTPIHSMAGSTRWKRRLFLRMTSLFCPLPIVSCWNCVVSCRLWLERKSNIIGTSSGYISGLLQLVSGWPFFVYSFLLSRKFLSTTYTLAFYLSLTPFLKVVPDQVTINQSINKFLGWPK